MFPRVGHFDIKRSRPLNAYMYKHLTKGEKKKLKQARKRAIVWSVQKQLRKALNNQVISKKHKESEPEDQKPKAVPPTRRQAALLTRSYLTPPTAQPNQGHSNQYTTAPIMAEIETTLHTLQQQRDQLNITISVLQQQLQFLQSYTKSDEDYEFE